MRIYLAFLLTAMAAACTWPLLAQKPAPPQPGKVVTLPSAKMDRFPKPVITPTHARPDRDIDAHRWHWHPHYGWVALPLTARVETAVLPADYALPAQVQVYQSVQPCVAVCPHCGQQITVTLGR